MKIFLHALFTWLFAISLFIILENAITWTSNNHTSGFEIFVSGVVTTAIFCFIFSLPSLFISIAALAWLMKVQGSFYLKLSAWFLLVFAAILLNILLLAFLTNSLDITWNIISDFWPAFAAAFLSILIRYRQFLILTNKMNAFYHSNILELLFDNSTN